MTKVVSYAYTTQTGTRPTLSDQFEVCRGYASAQGYTIVGEFNEIDKSDHPADGGALEAVRNAFANDEATAVLVYAPDDTVLAQLQSVGGTVEAIPARSTSTD